MRKHAKDSSGEGGAGEVEIEDTDGASRCMAFKGQFGVEIECVLDKLAAKAQKITIKLPWEITTLYSEVLRQSGHQSDDEEDEDDIEAHEASIQRLKVRLSHRLHT